jgi:DNA-binding response OmpR family regulator
VVTSSPDSPPASEFTPEGLKPSASLKVLVVDDNVDAADTLGDLLRLSGHEVSLAYDGLSALKSAQSSRPQAVVLDLGLPGMNGFDVARSLREDATMNGMLLIAVSGYGQDEDRRRTTEAGFDRHFVKPLDFQALLSALGATPSRNHKERAMAEEVASS